MLESLIQAIKVPKLSDEAKDIADAMLQQEEPTTSPLDPSTSEYVNELAKETYGDDTALIETEQDLREANRRAAINAAIEDFDASVERDTQAVIEGKLSAYDMQRNALIRSHALLNAEDNGDFGLAVENIRQLSVDALVNNPSITNEAPSVTAELERINTNRAMLQQAAVELLKGASTADTVWSFARELIPGVSAVGTYSRLPEELRGDFYYGTTQNPLTYRDMWNRRINNLSNEDMKKSIQDYVKWLKDEQGYSDAMAGKAIMTALDPSPTAEMYGLAGDVLAIATIGLRTGQAAVKGGRVLYNTEKTRKLASKLDKALTKLNETGKGSEKVQATLKAFTEAKDALETAKSLKGLPKVLDHTLNAALFGVKEVIESFPVLGPLATKFTVQGLKNARMLIKISPKAKDIIKGVAQESGLVNADDIIEVASRLNVRDELIKAGAISEDAARAETAVRPVELTAKETESTIKELVRISEDADMSTAVGRKKAVRDTSGAAKTLVETVKNGDKDDINVVRVIGHEYIDGAANVTTPAKSLSHVEDVKLEKDYQLLVQRALTQLTSTGKLGVTGLRAEMISAAATDLMDSLDASSNLYRTTGISNVMRTQLMDVLQEDSKGNLFAVVRSNKFYKTKESAQAAARKLSSKGTVETFVMPTRDVPKGAQDSVDGWAVDAKINLNKGFGSLAYEQLGNEDRHYVHIASALKTATSNPMHVRRLNALRENEASHLLEFSSNAQRAYKAVKGDDKALLNMLLDHSLETEAWFKPEYLKAKGVPQKTIDAYTSFRLFNDLDWMVMNSTRREEMLAQGLRRLHFGDKSLGYGRILRGTGADEIKSTHRLIIFGDVDATPAKFEDLGISAKALKENYLDKGWVVVERSYGPDEFTDAGSVWYVLPGHALTESNIPAIVTNYVAGGRRFFNRDAGFVKQLKFTKNSTGRDVITGVNTFATDADFAGLENKVGKIEAIRQELVKQRQTGVANDAAIAALIEKLGLTDVPFTDGTSFAKWASARGMDLEHLNNNLVVLRDGEGFEKVANIAREYESALSDEELASVLHRSAYQAMTNEKKMRKWMREGKDLLAYNFKDTAKIADYDKVMHYMAQDMINAGVMRKYTDMIAEDFAKQFRTVIPGSDSMSARQMLYYVMNGNKLVDNSTLSKQAITAAKNYMAVRSIPSDLDAGIAKVFNDVFKSLGVDALEAIGVSDKISHNLRAGIKAIDAKNPQKILRHNASLWWMGLVNMKQLLSQSAPVIYFTAMDPVNTAKTMKYWLPMTFEMLSSQGSYSKAFEKFIAKSGDNAGYAQGLWKALMDGRIFENTPLGGAFEAKSRNALSNLERISYAPKTFAEILNRVAAHSVAYEKLGFGSKGIQTAADMARWKSLGNSYYINMDATGLARVQSSQTGKTLLQFWSANMRFWETMMFDKNLSVGQRTSLAATTLALSGLGGFIGVKGARNVTDAVKDAFNVFEPEEFTERKFTEEQASMVQLAVEGGLLAYMAGTDGYDFSSKIALPVSDMVEKFDEISSLDMLKIPAATAISQQAGFVKDLFNAVKTFNTNTSTYEGWVNSLRVIQQGANAPSGLKADINAALYLMEGKRWNTKGQLKDEDNSLLAAVMSTIGVDKVDMAHLTRAYVDYSRAVDKEKALKDLIRPWYNLYVDTHSDSAWEQIQHIKQNCGLPWELVIKVERDLQKEERFSTIKTDKERKLLQQLRHSEYGTYINQLQNIERKQ